MDGRLILYSACVAGAIGVYLLLSRSTRSIRTVGVLLGLGAFGMLIAQTTKTFAPDGSQRPELFFLVFSAIAIIGAVRMITSHKPVYSALYFVLVVISSAGLFLLLEAEFLAFALVIVYAGAILITYLFVLMLAQQAPQPGNEQGQPDYDVVPREPASAVAVGFILLAVLGEMIFAGSDSWPHPRSAPAATKEAWSELEMMPGRLQAVLADQTAGPTLTWPPEADEHGRLIRFDERGAYVRGRAKGADELTRFDLPQSAMPDNLQRVGLALVAKFPVSLELAGVILTMAMFGAVILARRQIELDDDEKRQAAGLRRLGLETGDEPRAGGRGPGGPGS